MANIENTMQSGAAETAAPTSPPSPENLSPENLSPKVVKRNWIGFALLGAFLVAGGAVAIASPVGAGVAATLVVAWVMLIAAALQIWHALTDGGWRARIWSLISGLIYLAGGALLLLNPLAGMVTLSLVMLAVFLIDGLVRIVLALAMRPERGWGWMLASGVLTAAVSGALAAYFLPAVSVTLLGVMAGVMLMFEGWAFIIIAFAARPESDRTVYPDAKDRASKTTADKTTTDKTRPDETSAGGRAQTA